MQGDSYEPNKYPVVSLWITMRDLVLPFFVAVLSIALVTVYICRAGIRVPEGNIGPLRLQTHPPATAPSTAPVPLSSSTLAPLVTADSRVTVSGAPADALAASLPSSSLAARPIGGGELQPAHAVSGGRPGAAVAAAASVSGIALVNEHGKPVQPTAVVFAGNDAFFLDPSTLWVAPNAVPTLHAAQKLVLKSCGPGKSVIGHTPMQEFSNCCFNPTKQALEVLDKSGDIFEYNPVTKQWLTLRPNSPLGSPDPEYIDMSVSGRNVLLLDPERNQIWRYPATSARYFREVMPWRLKSGDISVADGIAIAYDGDTWVLRRNGTIARFKANVDSGMGIQLPFHWSPPKHFRPSRMYTQPGMPLFVVERENNRVLTVDKKTGAVKQYLLASDSDLRGLEPGVDRFYAINGPALQVRMLDQADTATANPNTRQVDTRLAGLTMPLDHAVLPKHAGVWPGARRLYRYGIHKGTDFFSDAGPVRLGTSAFAADAGTVVRADGNFKDMDAAKYSHVMYECRHLHITTEPNEDLLRGCQVWIDHGNGLITKYAHLDRIRPGLKEGMRISRGDLVGYVGVSGTGENLPGRCKHPHLHFEVWLDGKYVGFGLTPAETIGVYEDVFGMSSRPRVVRGVRKA